MSKQIASKKTARKVTFSDKPGFWAAFILGGIISFALLNFLATDTLAIFVTVVFLLILLYVAKKGIDENPDKGQYNLFVAIEMVMFGFIIGGVLLWLMQKHSKIYRHFIAIAIVITLIELGAGFALVWFSPYTIYNLGATYNVTSAQANAICNNSTGTAMSLFVFPAGSQVVDTYCTGTEMYAEVNVSR